MPLPLNTKVLKVLVTKIWFNFTEWLRFSCPRLRLFGGSSLRENVEKRNEFTIYPRHRHCKFKVMISFLAIVNTAYAQQQVILQSCYCRSKHMGDRFGGNRNTFRGNTENVTLTGTDCRFIDCSFIYVIPELRMRWGSPELLLASVILVYVGLGLLRSGLC